MLPDDVIAFVEARLAPAGEMQGLWTALRLLASHWADHKAYDPAWNPGD